MPVYGKTDVGKLRKNNQDIFAYKEIDEQLLFAIVCDGMGGEKAGQVASSVTCGIIFDTLVEKINQETNPLEYTDIIVNAISDANMAVYDMSENNIEYQGMGTTVVVLLKAKDKVYVAHVGDSRAYMFKEDTIYQITKDHSLVQSLFEEGKIKEEEMQNHPRKNLITRAVGVSCLVDIDFTDLSGIENAKFLLCTDGLTNLCTNKALKQIVVDTPEQHVVDTFINLANRMGGQDNITAVYIV